MRMRNLSLLPLALTLALLSPARGQSAAQSSSWVMLGPDGGDARSLAGDPHDPSRIFLGTSAGELYLSTNGGAQWTRLAHLGGGSDYVLDHISVDPRNSNLIYVAAWSVENNGGDLYRSRDAGKTWDALPGTHGKSIRAFAIAPSDPDTLVAGALDGVFRSRDRGDTWERISPPNHAEIKNIESVAIDPRNPDVIYAGTWHLPWKTIDGGRTWHSIRQGVVDDSDVFSLIVDPITPNVVYASACSGIYKSESAGELFRKVQGIPFSARRTRVLRQDPSNSLVVYAGTTEGLWKTVDAGQTWNRVTPPNFIVNDVLIDPSRAARVLLATDRAGIFASNDGAQSFAPSNFGFSRRQVTAVVADRSEPATWYAGVLNDKEFGGVFVTRNAGRSWRQLNSGLRGQDIFSLTQSPSGELLAGTNSGIFVFDFQKTMWTPSNLVLNEKFTPVTRRGSNSKVRRMITRREFVRDRIRGRVTQVIATPRRWMAAVDHQGVFVSLDHGRSWHGGPIVGERDFISLAALEDRVAITSPRSLWLSNDGTTTWTAAAVPAFVSRIYRVTLDRERVWITTHEGTFYSADNGRTWAHILLGAPPAQAVAIEYDRTSDRTLAITPDGQVFSTSDGGQNWAAEATAGWHLRGIGVAGGRFLGFTPFSGIVGPAQIAPEPQAVSSTTGKGR